MSKAANPGLSLASTAKEGNPDIYEGDMGGSPVVFYINYETKTFLCEATVESKEAKMVGNLEFDDSGNITMSPIWGIQPFGQEGEWVDTSGEEVKKVNVSSGSFDFEGCKCTKVSK